MERIIALLNRLSDLDWGWWPLLKLRPAVDRNMDNRVVVRLTLFFATIGVMLGLLLALLVLGVPLSIVRSWSLLILLVAWLAFFLLYRFTFVAAWNSRAERLRRGGDEG